MNNFPPFPEKIVSVEKNDTGSFYIYKDYVIGVVPEGANLKIEQLSLLVALYEKHFSSKNFVYISYRIHSYSIDPLVYPYLLEMTQLKGIAVVTNKKLFKKNFQIEKVFYSGNIRIFDTLEEAIKWSHDIID